MIHLITSFYNTPFIERNNELLMTLIKNIRSKYIEKIHLFIESDFSEIFVKKLVKEMDKERKLKIIKVDTQPLYSDFFEYANKLHNKVCMISNSDIRIFSINNIKLIRYLNPDVIYALTRHEAGFSDHRIKHYGFSHDCFIFRSPLDKLDLNKLKVKQNVWGSESLVLQELKKKDYITRNPCKHIIIIHEHQSDIREKNRGSIVGAGESDYYSCKPLPLNTRINEIYQKKSWNL